MEKGRRQEGNGRDLLLSQIPRTAPGLRSSKNSFKTSDIKPSCRHLINDKNCGSLKKGKKNLVSGVFSEYVDLFFYCELTFHNQEKYRESKVCDVVNPMPFILPLAAYTRPNVRKKLSLKTSLFSCCLSVV